MIYVNRTVKRPADAKSADKPDSKKGKKGKK